jgi:hypothetical protein
MTVVASIVVGLSGRVLDSVGFAVLAAVGSVVPEVQAAIAMAATVAIAMTRMASVARRPGRTGGVGSTVMMSPPRELGETGCRRPSGRHRHRPHVDVIERRSPLVLSVTSPPRMRSRPAQPVPGSGQVPDDVVAVVRGIGLDSGSKDREG